VGAVTLLAAFLVCMVVVPFYRLLAKAELNLWTTVSTGILFKCGDREKDNRSQREGGRHLFSP
jgi:hypothetical protein